MASSRFTLQPLPDPQHPIRQVFAGWDAGEGTYFAQIFDGVDEHGWDILTLERGSAQDRILTAGEIIDALHGVAVIPADFDLELILSVFAENTTIADLRQQSDPGPATPEGLDTRAAEALDVDDPLTTSADLDDLDDLKEDQNTDEHSGLGY